MSYKNLRITNKQKKLKKLKLMNTLHKKQSKKY